MIRVSRTIQRHRSESRHDFVDFVPFAFTVICRLGVSDGSWLTTAPLGIDRKNKVGVHSVLASKTLRITGGRADVGRIVVSSSILVFRVSLVFE